MKLLAIDGNSLLNRSFYGIKILTTKDGRYTNGVYGFITTLNRLLEQEQPDGVAVAFDVHEPTFRHKAYSAYKAGRRATPQELLEQFPLLKEWLTLAGYTCVECPGYEADDILGTLAETAERCGDTCVIATGDRDSLQLISERTRVLLATTRMGKTEILNYTPQLLSERYGLTPPEMIELKALMGDSSDNIPGVKGVGEKTAADLIRQYHSIAYIYDHLETLDIKAGVRAKLAADRESAEKSRWLGTICRTAPIDTNFESYRIKPRQEAALCRLMTELEFFKLMEKMQLSPMASAMPTAENPPATLPVIPCPAPLPSPVVLWRENGQAAGVCTQGVFALQPAETDAALCNPAIKKWVYDSKACFKALPQAQNITFDARLAGYLCNPSASSYDAERLVREYGSGLTADSEAAVLQNAVRFFDACTGLQRALTESRQSTLLDEIELPLARVLAAMEDCGFLVDTAGLREMGADLSAKIETCAAEIYAAVGREFNLNSPKQLGIALFEDLGIVPAKKTKNGYSTAAEVLEKLQNDYPIVGKVLQYRQYAKLKSTYCDGLLAAVAADGRVHSTFNQVETRTGRISSLEPNLQNIPVRTAEGRRLRDYFVAAPGFVLCDADYSQIELRVLAALADDKAMIEAFLDHRDIHTATAARVFDMPPEMVTPQLRRSAKAVNFGIIYGMGAFSLAQDIHVSNAEAARYIKDYLATYPGIAQYMDRAIADAKRDGFVTTLFGRRRYLPELASSNHMMRAFGERVARNAPIQGTAADIIKIAMIRVYDRLQRELPEGRLILQVHDELIVECPENARETACRILQEEMENAVQMAVPLSVDAHTGKTWLEAKE